MRMPPDSPDLETAKMKIATRFRNVEIALMEQLGELATSGFADARLCAMARSDFERGFLELEKAIRMGAPNDYAKHPVPSDAKKFALPPAGDYFEAHEGRSRIEWRDAGPEDDKPA